MNYQKIYNDLIERAKGKNRKKSREQYYERHHITPRCLGGDDSNENLVLLTAREHFIAHKLLYFINQDNKSLFWAYFMMFNVNDRQQRDYNMSSREYEKLKLKCRELLLGRVVTKEMTEKRLKSRGDFKHTEETKEKIRQTNMGHGFSKETLLKFSEVRKGKKASEETVLKLKEYHQNNPMIFTEEIREKIRLSKIGKPRSEECKNKISEKNSGRIQPIEEKLKRSKSLKGKEKSDTHKLNLSLSRKNQKRIMCPHCSIVGSQSNMTRYHFDNCKFKKEEVAA